MDWVVENWADEDAWSTQYIEYRDDDTVPALCTPADWREFRRSGEIRGCRAWEGQKSLSGIAVNRKQ